MGIEQGQELAYVTDIRKVCRAKEQRQLIALLLQDRRQGNIDMGPGRPEVRPVEEAYLPPGLPQPMPQPGSHPGQAVSKDTQVARICRRRKDLVERIDHAVHQSTFRIVDKNERHCSLRPCIGIAAIHWPSNATPS